MSKKALITGFTGQDGSYLAQLLLSKGYDVYGMIRRVSHPDFSFIKEMGLEKVNLVEGDLTDTNSLYEIIRDVKPDELYNLAAMSHVGTSFHHAESTADITGLGCLRLLEQIRLHSPNTRFYQASSSEMFGNTNDCPQNENTIFMPRSPYATAKVFAHNTVKVYRESYKLHASCGILQNHDSCRRGTNFVTRKITNWIGNYIYRPSNTPHLKLGYIDSHRDFGFAPDMVYGMWLMLQQEKPDDYVLGTGEHHSVREFAESAFKEVDIDLVWSGKELNEKGIDKKTGNILIEIDSSLYRSAEVPLLCGDYSKAKNILGWEPKTRFKELVKIMVDYDIKKNKNVSS